MQYLDQNLLYILLFIMLGLIFGSFATAVSYRLPRDTEFLKSRSKCPKCNKALGIPDLFPVFSWIFLGGKCRHCKAPIGVKYPLIELATAAFFALAYIKFGLTIKTAIICAISLCIVIMIVVDFEHYIIPDTINIALVILAVAYRYLEGAPWHVYIIGPLTGFAIGMALRYLIYFWKKQEGLGLGDVKFLVAVGLFLQPEILVTFFFLSGVIGILTAVIWRALNKGIRFPFGPALALSLYICLVFPEVHMAWQSVVRNLISTVLS